MRVLMVPTLWLGQESYTAINNDVKAIAGRTRAWYLENSYGKLVMDVTVSPTIQLATAPVSGIESLCWPALNNFGIKRTDFDRYVFCADGAPVGFGSKGYNSGVSSVIYCVRSQYKDHATRHELGHSLGLPHGGTLTATAKVSGSVVTIPALSVHTQGQTTALYDKTDNMCYEDTWSHHTARSKALLGWITPTFYTRGGAQTYQLTPLAVAGGDTYLVRIACNQWDNSSVRQYYVERREALGFDNKLQVGNTGIIIRVSGDFVGTSVPFAINCHPGVYSSIALKPGETFTDGSVAVDVGANGLVTVRDAGSIVVTPPPPPPPAPNPNVAVLEVLQPAVMALRAGSVTQAQIDQIKSLVAALVMDVK